MYQFRSVLAIFAIITLLAGEAAFADTVRVRDNADIGPGVFGNDRFRTVDVVYNGTQNSVTAGVFNLQYKTDDGYLDFETFCLEYFETLSLPADHKRISAAERFQDSQLVEALGSVYGNYLANAGTATADFAAATQILIWELTTDGVSGFDLSSGVFSLAAGSVFDTASGIWTDFVNGQLDMMSFDVFAVGGSQDLLVSEVPVPGALILMLTGLAGLRSATRCKTGRKV